MSNDGGTAFIFPFFSFKFGIFKKFVFGGEVLLRTSLFLYARDGTSDYSPFR